MIAARRFYVRPLLTVFAALGFAILVALGIWQLKRLEWKEGLIAKVEARTKAPPIPLDEAIERQLAGEDMEYAPVRAAGAFSYAQEAHVFGTLDGAPGYYIFTPLLRVETVQAHAAIVYVNRGFVPQALKSPAARAEGQAGGVALVEGLFRTAERRAGAAAVFAPADRPEANEWYQRDPTRFAAFYGNGAPPYYIDQFAVEGQEWPKGGTTRLDFNNRHFEYALTWFGLAAALFGVWVVFSLKNPSETNNFKKQS